jgi:succinylglutamate desuccinylase
VSVAAIEDRELSGVELTQREIGHAGGHTRGPLVICVAGLHGNEPSGVVALRRLFRKIEDARISLKGELIGLAGNLQALAARRRYLAQDLNRVWTDDRVVKIRQGDSEIVGDPEDQEQRELLDALHGTIGRAAEPVLVLDLHSASSKTVPFLVLGDTLRNREFALKFPIPVILGLEEELEGTLMEYITGLGHVSLAFEGGQHSDRASVDHHEAAVWLALVHAGALTSDQVPEFAWHHHLLHAAGRGVPRIMEVLARHEIDPADEFVMRPGYRTFDPVQRDDHLANDRNGRILSPGNYRMVLPLYQGQGSDGFFLARPVSRLWLTVSSGLRRIGMPKLAHRLPGVSRHASRKDTLIVHPRVARSLVRGFFHLLGYRIHSPRQDRWIASRRRE